MGVQHWWCALDLKTALEMAYTALQQHELIYVPKQSTSPSTTKFTAILSADDQQVSAKQLRSLPQPTVHHTTVFDSERAEIFVLGGAKQAGSDVHSDVFVYLIASDSWQAGSSLPSPRAEGSAVVADGILYLWGGEMVCSCWEHSMFCSDARTEPVSILVSAHHDCAIGMHEMQSQRIF